MLLLLFPAHQFEDLARRILEANNFIIRMPSHPNLDIGFDFFGTLANESWAIEVKFYRTARAQASLLENAAARLVARANAASVSKGMLVVSCAIPSALKESLEKKYSVNFIDRGDLTNWAATNPSLVDELNALLEVEYSKPENVSGVATTRKETNKKLLPAKSKEDIQGTTLCEELKALKRGKGAWAEYEKLCDKILRYLFPNDLSGWHAQKRTDDGLNRYDYVCRIRPTTEFWRFSIDHLNSRYVLFEFKNYTGQIKQGQVLTTEKYLLEKGLRRIAIIFTRGGAREDALKMAQGAMREHGKLMLIVSDFHVCEMLHMKERGEDPTDCLFELADNFLLTLPR